MSFHHLRFCAGAPLAALILSPAHAQKSLPTTGSGFEYVIVAADSADTGPAAPGFTATAARAAEQINIVNSEDMLKYAPSLLVRKRHPGDTQDPVATRTSGVGASARNLIFVDGIMINTPIGNNNGSASPHFGVAAPQDISRVDVLYGPFFAAYGGGSIGAVINITTRMPERFELYAGTLGAVQTWKQGGMGGNFGTWQLAGGIGDRQGAFAWRLSLNHLDSSGQPLALVIVPRTAAPGGFGTAVQGGLPGQNRDGAPITIIGAGGLEHQVQDTATLKLAYTFSNGWQGAYTASLFHQANTANALTYLRDGIGAPVYSGAVTIGGQSHTIGASAFSANVYRWPQTHLAQGLTLTSDSDGAFTWSLAASAYDYLADSQRQPATALPGAFLGGAGSINRLDGTGWYTLDADGAWRGTGGHAIAFGLHRDAQVLAQHKFAAADWIAGAPGKQLNAAQGRTATNALWLQDTWTITPVLTAALGARLEDWHAYDGANYSATPALNVVQPALSAQTLSPKLSLTWQIRPNWALKVSRGTAWRMPTVGELYQTVTTGTALTVPDPRLKPEHAVSHELAAARQTANGQIRIALFQEDIDNALLSQYAPLVAGSPTLYRFVQNVDHTRVRGIELYARENDVVIDGLELAGSLTFADGRIIRDPAFPAAVGKQLPQLPRWRANALATWRSGDWAFTMGARYSDPGFGTIDNSDPVSQTWQGFGRYLVADLRVRYQPNDKWTLSAGIDNLNNARYFLYHPFPRRTFMLEARYAR